MVYSINSMQFDKRKKILKNYGEYKYSFVHKRSNTHAVILWILHVFIYVHDMTAVWLVVVVIKERIKVLKIPLRTMPFSVENLLFLVMRCFLIAGKKQTTENYNVASYHNFRILLCCSWYAYCSACMYISKN